MNTYKYKKGDNVKVFRFLPPANYTQFMQSNITSQEVFKHFIKEDTGDQGMVFKRRKKSFGATNAGNEYYIKYDDGTEEWHSEKELETIK